MDGNSLHFYKIVLLILTLFSEEDKVVFEHWTYIVLGYFQKWKSKGITTFNSAAQITLTKSESLLHF